MRMGKRAALSMFFCLTLVVLTFAAAPMTAEDEAPAQLTGCLSASDHAGVYVLTDEASGEDVHVRGAQLTDGAVEHRVAVTGNWSKSDDGQEVFVVVEVENLGPCG